MPHGIRDQRGFTLAEMLVVCASLGVILSGVVTMMLSGQQAYIFGSTQVDAQQNVRVALERMSKDLREAGYSPQSPNTAPATCPGILLTPPVACYYFNGVTAGTGNSETMPTATSLTLKYDWNGDGFMTAKDNVSCPTASVIDPVLNAARGECVVYAVSGGNLTRQEVGLSGADGTAQVLATGLIANPGNAPVFSYLNENNTATTAVANIRTVIVTLTARTGARGAYVTMTDRVRVRNR